MKYKDKPESAGYYWLKNILLAAPARIVEVWGYEVDGALFTNDDGGASIDDEMYKKCEWLGPLIEPHPIFGDEVEVLDVSNSDLCSAHQEECDCLGDGDSSVTYNIIDVGDACKKGTQLNEVCPGQDFEPQD